MSSRTAQKRQAKRESAEFAALPARLTEALKGQNVAALARSLGVSRSALYAWAAGDSLPSLEKTIALASALNASLEWLATGEGPMRKGDVLARDDYQLLSADQMDQYALVPRYEVRAGAGHGQLVQSERIVDHLAFKLEWLRSQLGVAPRSLALITAVGDSMTPAIDNGDLLLIDLTQSRIRDNAIYVLNYADELVVKRLQLRRDGSVVIISDNKAYRSEEVAQAEVPALRVLGRVVWIGSTL